MCYNLFLKFKTVSKVQGDLFATATQGHKNNDIVHSAGNYVSIGNTDTHTWEKGEYDKGCSKSSSDFATCYAEFLTLGKYHEIEFLPIDLSAFSAQAIDEGALLQWTTQSELNNDFFTVLRSNDGSQFEEIAELDGANISSAAINYSFTDTHPYTGVSYYRLKQTDYDGKYSYSRVVPFFCDSHTPAFEIVPRTQNGVSTFDIHFSETTKAHYIALYTLNGTLLHSQVVPAGVSDYIVKLPLSAGIYVVNHVYNGSKQSVKITVQ
jgi:hypothetical protein